jgi:hypothetical protein
MRFETLARVTICAAATYSLDAEQPTDRRTVRSRGLPHRLSATTMPSVTHDGQGHKRANRRSGSHAGASTLRGIRCG